MNMLRETFWHHLQISKKDIPLPRDHSKRWKNTLPSLMRRHNCFRWLQTPLISGLSNNEEKKITMKFVKIPYCFHAFFWRSHTSPAFPSLLRTRHYWTIIYTKTRRRWESLTSYWPTKRENMPKGNEKEETQTIPWRFQAFKWKKTSSLRYKKMWRKGIFPYYFHAFEIVSSEFMQPKK